MATHVVSPSFPGAVDLQAAPLKPATSSALNLDETNIRRPTLLAARGWNRKSLKTVSFDNIKFEEYEGTDDPAIQSSDLPGSRWSREQCAPINCDLEHLLASDVDILVLGRSQWRLTTAIAALNAGSLVAEGGFCLVFSRTLKKYNLIWRADKLFPRPCHRRLQVDSKGCQTDEASSNASPKPKASPKPRHKQGATVTSFPSPSFSTQEVTMDSPEMRPSLGHDVTAPAVLAQTTDSPEMRSSLADSIEGEEDSFMLSEMVSLFRIADQEANLDLRGGTCSEPGSSSASSSPTLTPSHRVIPVANSSLTLQLARQALFRL